MKPAKVQNYMLQAPDYDPNSIINLYIQAAIPAKPAVVKSPIKVDRKAEPRAEPKADAKKAKPGHKQHKRKHSESSDEIAEEIVLSEDARHNEKESTISKVSESIVEEISSGDAAPVNSSGGDSKEAKPFQSLRDHKPFGSRQFSSSIVESIQEDFVTSNDKKAPSADRSSSILEDPNLAYASQSRVSSNKRGGNSAAIEESIEESIASGGSILQNSNSSSTVQAPKRTGTKMSEHELEREKTLKQIKDFEEQKQLNKEKN